MNFFRNLKRQYCNKTDNKQIHLSFFRTDVNTRDDNESCDYESQLLQFRKLFSNFLFLHQGEYLKTSAFWVVGPCCTCETTVNFYKLHTATNQKTTIFKEYRNVNCQILI